MGVEKSQSTVPVRRRGLFVPRVDIDRASPTPLYLQVCAQLAAAVRHGGQTGARLPSTRLMAHMLGVSRNTVLMAYEELVARGVLEGRPGCGTIVAARGTGAAGPFDPGRVLRDAQYPGRTVAFADPDGAPLYVIY